MATKWIIVLTCWGIVSAWTWIPLLIGLIADTIFDYSEFGTGYYGTGLVLLMYFLIICIGILVAIVIPVLALIGVVN